MNHIEDLDLFLNDNYQILVILYEHQQTINDNTFSPITQQEIAIAVGCSVMKVNPIIKKLKDGGYINPYKNSKGRYQLTDKAKYLIEEIKRIQGEKDNA
ncbi:MAG: nucleotidyl transferase [Lachnospiraceae bacterium]|nr:nucleotidyl transferase [Lachnospiraceae bacterium]